MAGFKSNIQSFMENSSRFDIENAIDSWRKQFAGSALIHENIAELEAHLRDSFENARQGGLPDEDAFAIALYRLGSRNLLAAEFARAHPERIWVDRVLWMLLGAQLFSFLGQLAELLRSLVSLPRLFFRLQAGFEDTGVFWSSMLWSSRFVFLAALLFGAFKLLTNSQRLWDDLLQGLERNPGKWCGSFVAISFVLGALSFSVMLLPSFVQAWFHSVSTTQYHYPNLLLTFLGYALHATLLPGALFLFLRRRSPVRA